MQNIGLEFVEKNEDFILFLVGDHGSKDEFTEFYLSRFDKLFYEKMIFEMYHKEVVLKEDTYQKVELFTERMCNSPDRLYLSRYCGIPLNEHDFDLVCQRVYEGLFTWEILYNTISKHRMKKSNEQSVTLTFLELKLLGKKNRK